MASHHQSGGNILPFGQPTDAPGPRFVRPIPAEQIARAMGEPIDLYDSLTPRRSLADRIGDALESRFALGLYVGVYIGCLLTVGLAYCWSVFSS